MRMISKIIQKEKDRQEAILKTLDTLDRGTDEAPKFQIRVIRYEHKLSLINLKEYLEDVYTCLNPITACADSEECCKNANKIMHELGQLREDIQELTKMIEIYA